MLRLDLEAVTFDAAEHGGVGVDLGERRQEQGGGLGTGRELGDAVRLEQVGIHVHAHEAGSHGVAAYCQPDLFGCLGMSREVTTAVFVHLQHDRLGAVVVQDVLLDDVEGHDDI